MLEPSAGTGLLAVFAARAGARLVLNEIDPARAEMLRAAFPGVAVTRHDAELIHDLLAPSIRPTAVLINPPFSRSIGRHADPLAAFRHLRAALMRLGAGGRCAAILPDRVDTSSRAWAKATEGCTLTLHLELPANAYAKHGTSQAVKIMVLEKGTGDHAELIRCSSLAEALAAIAARAVLPRSNRRNARVGPRSSARPAGRGSLLGGLAEQAAPRRAHAQSRAVACRAPIDYTVFAEPVPTGEAVGVYLPYRPSRIAIPCASAHPTALVESIAMGSITAPRPSYVPTLSQSVVDAKTLSDAQLETLIYAGDAFERDIPGRFKPVEEGLSLTPDEEGRPYRTGFFLGDGTGAGKGRQVAAIILDQWLRGRRKHIWISKTETLLEDARRDWTAVGGLALDIQHLNQWKLGTPIGAGEGILFLTYATLRSNRGDKGTRLQQILEWVGDDYDGMVVFDEAHEMAGVAGGEGRFGTKDGSDQGIAGVRLQNLLPRARVLYVSATGASDVNNLAYATRLGLWGPGTAFADRRTFVDSLRRGGIAAMELIARDLKMQGLYVARALSFAGVEYDILEHQLTPDQIEVYDAYADAWAIIHANLRAALDATRVTDSFSKDTYNSGAKAAALSIFESTKQRFFCQLLIGMKLPALDPRDPRRSRPRRERRDPARLHVRGDAQPGTCRADGRGTRQPRHRAFSARVRHVLSDGRLPGPPDENLCRRHRQDPLRTDVGRGRPPRVQPGGARDARQSARAALRPADRRLRARSYHRAFRHRCGRRGDGAQPARHHGRARPPARRKPLARAPISPRPTPSCAAPRRS